VPPLGCDFQRLRIHACVIPFQTGSQLHNTVSRIIVAYESAEIADNDNRRSACSCLLGGGSQNLRATKDDAKQKDDERPSELVTSWQERRAYQKMRGGARGASDYLRY
jgi:hypothetical protein